MSRHGDAQEGKNNSIELGSFVVFIRSYFQLVATFIGENQICLLVFYHFSICFL